MEPVTKYWVCDKRMKKNAGFTLIEIMLVVVLLSLSAVAVLITMPNSSQDLAKEQAQRFFYKLQLLNEDAILNGKDYGIRIDEKHFTYTFQELTADGWQAYDTRFYGETELEESLELIYKPGGSAWENNESLFKQESLFDEDMFADLEEEEKLKPPQIFVLSSGEITPFDLMVFPKGQAEERGWRIVVKESGLIKLLAPGETDESDSDW